MSMPHTTAVNRNSINSIFLIKFNKIPVIGIFGIFSSTFRTNMGPRVPDRKVQKIASRGRQTFQET